MDGMIASAVPSVAGVKPVAAPAGGVAGMGGLGTLIGEANAASGMGGANAAPVAQRMPEIANRPGPVTQLPQQQAALRNPAPAPAQTQSLGVDKGELGKPWENHFGPVSRMK